MPLFISSVLDSTKTLKARLQDTAFHQMTVGIIAGTLVVFAIGLIVVHRRQNYNGRLKLNMLESKLVSGPTQFQSNI